MPVARCSKAAGGTVSRNEKCGSVAHEVSGGRWLCHLLHAAVNCGQNRKPQCKIRQRSLRSKQRKAAQPPVTSVGFHLFRHISLTNFDDISYIIKNTVD